MPQVKRKWRSFAEARDHVRALGLKCQKDYEAWSKSGQRPADIPGSPAKAYGAEWPGWADFLGNGGARPLRTCAKREYRPFAEAREFVRKLGLRTQRQYSEWARSGDRPEGIPANPYLIYGDEWTDWADWLGQRGADGYRPFVEARAYAQSKQFKTRQEWIAHAMSPEFPLDLPIYPEYAYRDAGWMDWADWIGTEGKLNRPRILELLNAIKEVIPHLRPSELYVILRHKKVLSASVRHTRIDALRALERLCHAVNVDATLDEVATALEKTQAEKLNVAENGQCATEEEAANPVETELTPEDIERASPIPRVKSIDGLRVLDEAANSGLLDDDELVEFLISSRIAALWQEVLDGNPAFTPESLLAAPSGRFFDIIRDRFLSEHAAVVNLPVPTGYAFHKNGQLALPNLMQRLTAYRLANQKRLINASGVGAGKSLAAVYASQVIGAKLIVIVAVNATLQYWSDTIANAFPNAVRLVKDRGPFTIDPSRPTFVILNFESFQQTAWSDELLGSLLAHPIDLFVVDEIQLVRFRGRNDESSRRRRVRELIQSAGGRNPSLFVLGMSATPMINELHEAKTLLELVLTQDLKDLPTRSTISNAILYHQLLMRHGLRHRPNYPQSIETSCPVIDGLAVLPQLRNVKARDVLGLEQAVLNAKLPMIRQLVRPGTLIFTPFVTGIIEPLVAAVTDAGFKAGVFTGDEKSGYDQFVAREVDVLIGSEPIGTGVDGLQEVSNRLIFASLPWTGAHYDQVVGRLHRQGSVFDRIEVFVPLVELRQGNGSWSWDRRRLDRIRFKRTLADAVVDGVIPEGKLPSREEMQDHSLRALQAWINQVQGGTVIADANDGDSTP